MQLNLTPNAAKVLAVLLADSKAVERQDGIRPIPDPTEADLAEMAAELSKTGSFSSREECRDNAFLGSWRVRKRTLSA